MALKLYTVTPGSAVTQVSATKQPCRQAILQCASAFSIGDKTLSSTNGVNVAANGTLVLGGVSPTSAFDITELYIYATSGTISILCILL